MSAATAGRSHHARSRSGIRNRSALAKRSGRRTFYDLLQVSPRAEETVLQAAYRTLARAYHPDLNRDPDAVDRMRELNDAYRVLSDPRRRAIYDLELNQRRCNHDEESGFEVRRETSCWRCEDALGSGLVRYCSDCRWIICEACRGCGCERPRPQCALPTLSRRAQAAAGWFAAAAVLLVWFVSSGPWR